MCSRKNQKSQYSLKSTFDDVSKASIALSTLNIPLTLNTNTKPFQVLKINKFAHAVSPNIITRAPNLLKPQSYERFKFYMHVVCSKYISDDVFKDKIAH